VPPTSCPSARSSGSTRCQYQLESPAPWTQDERTHLGPSTNHRTRRAHARVRRRARESGSAADLLTVWCPTPGDRRCEFRFTRRRGACSAFQMYQAVEAASLLRMRSAAIRAKPLETARTATCPAWHFGRPISLSSHRRSSFAVRRSADQAVSDGPRISPVLRRDPCQRRLGRPSQARGRRRGCPRARPPRRQAASNRAVGG